MLPFAPVRLSMTTCWPRPSEIFCPSVRANVSVLPPGAKGTTKRIGLVGKAGAGAAYVRTQHANAIARVAPSNVFSFTSLGCSGEMKGAAATLYSATALRRYGVFGPD